MERGRAWGEERRGEEQEHMGWVVREGKESVLFCRLQRRERLEKLPIE